MSETCSLGGAEVEVRYQAQALLERELFGPGAHQQHVAGLLHHMAGELHRVPDVPHGRHRAGAQLLAVHDGRIKLGGAVARERGAVTGVEERVVLQDPHRAGDRVQAGAALLEHRVAAVEGGGESCAVACLTLRGQGGTRDGAGAAVDGNGMHGLLMTSSWCRGTWRSGAARGRRVRRGTCRCC
jgi:hypothetical protein